MIGERDRKSLARVIAIAVVVAALVYAWRLAWVAEDAFISFRYARNLLEGHGLVFNPGERVEGYTNFLWTVLLAFGLRTGASPLSIATVLGLSASALALYALLRLRSLIEEDWSIFPAAAAALAANYTWASFSTSGLETSLLSCLLISLVLVLVRGSQHGASSTTTAGVLAALAMMTRPDAALIVPPALLFLGMGDESFRHRLLRIGSFLLAAAVPFVPYFVWRTWFYGDIFPNTFYAKSAADPYYGQGLFYLSEFLQRHLLWLWLPWPFAALVVRRLTPSPAGVLLASYCLLHTLYVVRIGGDFMEGRFFIPVLPFFYLLCERAVRTVFRPVALRGSVLAVLVAATALSPRVLEPGTIERGITDERTWAPAVALWLEEGKALGKHLPMKTIVATDAVGAFGYASGLSIVDTLGLTDAEVARGPATAIPRPGHRKVAPVEYLARRNVDIVRDGKNLYRFDREPDYTIAGNRYFVLSDDPVVVAGFKVAVADLEGLGDVDP